MRKAYDGFISILQVYSAVLTLLMWWWSYWGSFTAT